MRAAPTLVQSMYFRLVPHVLVRCSSPPTLAACAEQINVVIDQELVVVVVDRVHRRRCRPWNTVRAK